MACLRYEVSRARGYYLSYDCASEMGDKPHTHHYVIVSTRCIRQFCFQVVLFNMGLRVDIFSTSANNSLFSLPSFS